eukprot:gene13628-28943_t
MNDKWAGFILCLCISHGIIIVLTESYKYILRNVIQISIDAIWIQVFGYLLVFFSPFLVIKCVCWYFLDDRNELKPAFRCTGEFINLTSAIRGRRLDAIRLLIKKGADVNEADQHGIFPMEWAVSDKYVECMKLLLEHGADANIMIATDGNGLSLLGLCIVRPEKGLNYARVLIENGADVNASCDFGESGALTILNLAMSMKNYSLYKLLLQHGAKCTSITKAMLTNNRRNAQIRADELVSPTSSSCCPSCSTQKTKSNSKVTDKMITIMNTKSNVSDYDSDDDSTRYRAALTKVCTDGDGDGGGDLEVALCLVMMGADPWCAGLCADTGKEKPSPWENCNVEFREELERVWKKYVFITMSIVEVKVSACRVNSNDNNNNNKNNSNLFKRIKECNLDVWRVCVSYI